MPCRRNDLLFLLLLLLIKQMLDVLLQVHQNGDIHGCMVGRSQIRKHIRVQFDYT